jgi:hypothetical protein
MELDLSKIKFELFSLFVCHHSFVHQIEHFHYIFYFILATLILTKFDLHQLQYLHHLHFLT